MSVSNSTLSRPSLEETARKLCESRGGKWSGTKGMARCPAHDDRTPSLGVTLGRKAILLHCFAGCDQASVLAALAREGIETSALFSGSSDEFPIQPSYSNKPSAAALRIWRDARPRRNVLALEPCNCDRAADGTSGPGTWLAPGESWQTRLHYTFSSGNQEE